MSDQPTEALEPVKFLCDGTRYKVGFIEEVGTVITGLPENLEGEWVALVEATDNCHMKLTTPPDAAQIAEARRKALEDAAQICDKWVDVNHVYTNGAIQCAKSIREMK